MTKLSTQSHDKSNYCHASYGFLIDTADAKLLFCNYQTILYCRLECWKWIGNRSFLSDFLSILCTHMVILCHISSAVSATFWSSIHLSPQNCSGKTSAPIMFLHSSLCWRFIKQVVHCLQNCINTPGTPALKIPSTTWRLHNPVSIKPGQTSFSFLSSTMLSKEFQLTFVPFMEIYTNFPVIQVLHIFYNFLQYNFGTNVSKRCWSEISTFPCWKYFTIKSICCCCKSWLSDSSVKTTKHGTSVNTSLVLVKSMVQFQSLSRTKVLLVHIHSFGVVCILLVLTKLYTVPQTSILHKNLCPFSFLIQNHVH